MANSCHSSYYFPLVSGSGGQDSFNSFNSCSKKYHPHGKSVSIRVQKIIPDPDASIYCQQFDNFKNVADFFEFAAKLMRR